MTIGIYSGSFDPVHWGHINVAKYIAESGAVDEVWMLVTPLNPLKVNDNPPASNFDRFEMCRRATQGFPNLKVDDTEFNLPSPHFTYKTLCYLREKYPQHRFRLIVGSDNLNVFNLWRDSDKILSEFGLLVYPRPGFSPSVWPEGARLVANCPLSEISSTDVRKAVSEGQPIEEFTPQSVVQYIAEHKLYL